MLGGAKIIELTCSRDNMKKTVLSVCYCSYPLPGLLPFESKIQVPNYILKKSMFFILYWTSILSSSYAHYGLTPTVTSLPRIQDKYASYQKAFSEFKAKLYGIMINLGTRAHAYIKHFNCFLRPSPSNYI